MEIPKRKKIRLSDFDYSQSGKYFVTIYVTKQIGFSLWQKSFYDRIIRNEIEYREIWQYIKENPMKWEEEFLL